MSGEMKTNVCSNAGNNLTLCYYIFLIATLVTSSTYSGLAMLETSVNIYEDLGNITMGTFSASAIFVSLILAPISILKFGAKWTLVMSDIGFLFFTAANYFPKIYFAIPGAMFGALGACFMFSATPVYLNYLIKEAYYKKHEKDENISIHSMRSKWLGDFYGFFKTAYILGGLTCYATLYGGRKLGLNLISNRTVSLDAAECGSKFCSVNNTDSQDLHQFVPRSKVSLYLVYSCFAFLQLTSVVLHSSFLKNLKPFEDESTTNSTEKHQEFMSTIKRTFQQIVKRDQLLLAPLSFYYGCSCGSVYGNFTKAFISCLLGVEQVGLVMVVYGTSIMVSCWLFGRVAKKFGISTLVVIGCTIGLSNYCCQLIWQPSEELKYLVYGFAVINGFLNGIWQLATIDATALFFYDKEELALVVNTLVYGMGGAFTYFFSSLVCVSTLLCTFICLLLLGCLGYLMAELNRKINVFGSAEEHEPLLKDNP